MRIIKWTKAEDELLQQSYQLTKQELLDLFPIRNYNGIKQRAGKLGLKKERNEYVEGKLDILLDESHQTYYYIGFIFADGCFMKNRLQISLNKKDENLLQSFADYIQCPNLNFRIANDGFSKKNTEIIYLSIQDRFIVPKIKKKFDFKPRKTYNPPEKLPDDFELFLSLLIGYIDGDGCVKYQSGRKDCSITIKVHSSWLDWLIQSCKKIESYLNIVVAKPKINELGYALWNITNSKIIIMLKKHILKYNLKVLNRKWDKIDENYVSRYVLAKERKIKILEFKDMGLTNQEIANKLGINDSRVSVVLSKYKNIKEIKEGSNIPLFTIV